jgi:small neutral amino acid transporter SnatA (MarC family)
MSKRDSVNFPRINLISLLAGALALASVFLPWWGVDASGFGSFVSPRWTLWNGPSTDSIFRGSTQPYPTLTSASPIIGALVVISALLALAGSFARNIRPLIGSFILNVLTPIAYLGVVSYAVTNSCNGQSNCLSGPFGTETVFGITLSWGFQIGFYLYVVAGTLTLVGLGFHRIFHKTSPTTQKLSPQTSTSTS